MTTLISGVEATDLVPQYATDEGVVHAVRTITAQYEPERLWYRYVAECGFGSRHDWNPEDTDSTGTTLAHFAPFIKCAGCGF